METVLTSVSKGLRTIKFNRPAKKNALSILEYEKLRDIIQDDAKNVDTTGVILTGEGDFFTSGNDMKAVLTAVSEKDLNYLNKSMTVFRSLIETIINYPKLTIAVVNGPAVGIGTTILGLCDIVHASTTSYFQMPFVTLGLNVEGCASYTFPRRVGSHLYTEMVFGGKKVDAHEAYKRNLVGSLFEPEKIGDVFKELEMYGSLPLNTVKCNKALTMDNIKKDLLECNRRETEMFKVAFVSQEFFDAVLKFAGKKTFKPNIIITVDLLRIQK